MDGYELLKYIRENGGEFSIDLQGHLRYSAPCKVLTLEIRRELFRLRKEILAILEDEAEANELGDVIEELVEQRRL